MKVKLPQEEPIAKRQMKIQKNLTQLSCGNPPPSLILIGVLIISPVFLQAQVKARNNPASKVYIADVSGEAVIDTGGGIADLVKRSVHNAQGTVIETKRTEGNSNRSKFFSTMVYSNGTGAYFDSDTRVEVKRFIQEPFTPTRSDMEVEPSISQTQAFVTRGSVGLCTSKLVAGSNMTYSTPHASVNVRGRKVVIETTYELTRISMLEGDSTVRAGPMDPGGHLLKSGEQAIIRRDQNDPAKRIEIHPIPKGEMSQLDDKVALACLARTTVYFEVRPRVPGTPGAPGTPEAAATGDSAAGSSSPDSAGSSTFSPVTAFDSTSAASASNLEIVPVEILSPVLPVEHTVSTASLPSAPVR